VANRFQRLTVNAQFLNLSGQCVPPNAELVCGLDAASASVLQGLGDEDALEILGLAWKFCAP